MFTKAFTHAKDWGWTIDDDKITQIEIEEKDPDDPMAMNPKTSYHLDMSTNQMLGFVNESNVHDRLYKSSLFDKQNINAQIPPKIDKAMYGDNPKIVQDYQIQLPNSRWFIASFNTEQPQ